MRLLCISLALALLAAALWFAMRRSPASSDGHEVLSASSNASEPRGASGSKQVGTAERQVVEGATCRMLAVTKDGSQPVAHAQILLQKPGLDLLAWEDAAARFGSAEGALAHGLGDSYETDERGEVLVPVVDQTRPVCAWRDDLFGETDIAQGASEVTIELSRARTLDIDVVDDRGVPVPNVCVAFLAIARPEFESVGGAWTDSSGRVHIDDLNAWRWHDNAAWRFGAAYGATQPEFIDLDQATPLNTIRFVLGATGDVELALADANGSPLATGAEYGLYVDDHRIEPPRGLEPDGWHSRFTNDGRTIFEHVALDLPLAVHVWARGFEFEEPEELRGPSLPGERKRIELRCKAVHPIVHGRVVDPSGRPLSEANLIAKEASSPELERFAESQRAFEASTDDNGAFEEALHSLGQPSTLPPLVIAACGDNRPTYVAHVASSPGPPVVRPGFPPRFELGTIVAEPLPLLASGVVVDARGRPVAGARVEAREADDDQGLRIPPTGVDFTSDEHGRFVVSGHSRPTRILLRAKQYLQGTSTPVQVDVGAADIRITLGGQGGISGRFLLPDDLTIDDLRLSFQGTTEGSADRSRPGNYETHLENGFVTGPIEPGHWSLAVYLGGGSEPISRRDGIVVDASARVDLGEIDLRPRFRSLEIEIVDEGGSPLESAQLAVFDSKGDLIGDRRASTASQHRISLLPPVTMVCVSADGYRTQTFDDVRDGATWTMRKSYDVRLRWPASLPRIEPPFRLSIHSRFSGDSPLTPCARGVAWRAEKPTEPGSEVEIDASIAGKWVVSYDLFDGRSGDRTPINLRPAQVLEIADTKAPQAFTVEVDPAIVMRAIESARPR